MPTYEERAPVARDVESSQRPRGRSLNYCSIEAKVRKMTRADERFRVVNRDEAGAVRADSPETDVGLGAGAQHYEVQLQFGAFDDDEAADDLEGRGVVQRHPDPARVGNGSGIDATVDGAARRSGERAKDASTRDRSVS
jgi:hypothetical protein